MNGTISLPEDLLKKADELAAFEGVPVEQFLSATPSGQFAGLEYLKQRAERASTERFRAALLHIPDVEPEEYDRFDAVVRPVIVPTGPLTAASRRVLEQQRIQIPLRERLIPHLSPVQERQSNLRDIHRCITSTAASSDSNATQFRNRLRAAPAASR